MFLTVVIGGTALGVAVLVGLAIAVVLMKREDKRMRLHHTPATARERYSRWVMGLYVRDEDECPACPDPRIPSLRKGGDQQ
ncbi:hypothetical protein [Planobispora rosea]|uniref:hypothetical protein n=1 Tax=Planobispora rosea TaxID=35762 RepID=UPI00083B65B4|nr:hypothetical protein [Planobispora rosea]